MTIEPLWFRSSNQCERLVSANESWLLRLHRWVGHDRCCAFGIDVENQEREWLITGVSPLMHERGWFIDKRTRLLGFGLALDRDGAGADEHVVERRPRTMVGHVRR